MIAFPNAKINLGLHILSKRKDGFHDIETVFYPLMIHDSLEILTAGDQETSFKQYGLPLNSSKNLCEQAYELLKLEYDLPPVEMHLLKHIPVGAGLGGGSSDAAFTLLTLNELFGLGISSLELEKIAAGLGSDCAFFIRNRPLFATGRGELFEPLEIDLSAFEIRMAKPDIHISTPEAYAMATPKAGRPSLREVITNPIAEWKDCLFNDFEGPIFDKYPEIRIEKEKMYEQGAIYAAMSGSGSAVFGIFEG